MQIAFPTERFFCPAYSSRTSPIDCGTQQNPNVLTLLRLTRVLGGMT